MVSQKSRYFGVGIFVMVASVVLIGIGVFRLFEGGGVDAAFTMGVGAIVFWAGLKRAKVNPWFCPACKSREFM
jgi:hypothetical protein